MTLSINDHVLVAEDGTQIAYAAEGAGPALVLTNGLTTTTTFWKYVRPAWLRNHRVVTWDLPGHGNSGAAASDASTTVEAQAGFVRQIMQKLGIERASQVGWSTGTQVVLELARQAPESCDRLVLILGGAEHALSGTQLPVSGAAIERMARVLPPAAFAVAAHVLASAFRKPGARYVGRWFGLIGPRVSARDMTEITEHLASLDWGTLQQMLQTFQAHSAVDVLSKLAAPPLIIAGDEDPFAPSELVGLPLHRVAPQSMLVRLAEGTHTALLEEPQSIAGAVLRHLEA